MWAAKHRATIGRGAGLVLLALLPVVACAQTTSQYNVQPRTFRACRLLLPQETNSGAGTYENPAGSGRYWTMQGGDAYSLIFEGMRRFPDRPAGWELMNPLAQNPAWLKSDVGYWDVPATVLDNSQGLPAPVLRDMDLIYIRAPQLNLPVDVWPQWRSALLRAVQDGAVLWIDQEHVTNNACAATDFCPPGSMLTTGAPFSFAKAAQSAGSYRRAYVGPWVYPPAGGPAGDMLLNRADRLLEYPFPLQEWQDIQYLGLYPRGPNNGTSATDPIPDNAAEGASPDVVNLVDVNLRPVVVVADGANWYNNIAVGRFGAGAIVITAGDVGYDVVNWWRGAHRNRPVLHETADCKFAWNVLALAQDFSQRGGSSSGSAANPAASAPPLDIQWQFPDRFTVPTASNPAFGAILGAPAVGRRMTFAVSQGTADRDPWIMAFDNDPAQDLDNDGYADDGPRDFTLGASYDLVWERDLCSSGYSPRWSSPTVATMRLPSGESVEVVLVSFARATTLGANAFVRCFRANSGDLLWERTISAYRSQGRVVDLSTPVVYGDWVFVLSSEYDTGADAGSGAEDTYGRAHCFQLSYDWSADQDGPQWAFPDSTNNPNGDGDTTSGTPDNATPELQRYLPPFQDPLWVAGVGPYDPRPVLPPFPTVKPTIFAPDPPASNSGVNVYLRCCTPISLRRSSTAGEVDNDTTVGGCDYVLVPTPLTTAETGTDLLNVRYFRVWLPEATALTDGGGNYLVEIDGTGIVQRPDDNNITATITDGDGTAAGIQPWRDPVDGRIYAFLRSGEAREYLLQSATPGTHFLDLIEHGAAITIPYKVRPDAGTAWGDVPSLTAVATLPGPAPLIQTTGGPNERRVASATIHHGNSLYATDAIENNDGTLVHNDLATADAVPPGAGPYDSTGRITSVNSETGETNWSVDPALLLHAQDPGQSAHDHQTVAPGGVAVDPATGTAAIAMALRINPDSSNPRAVKPMVLGLNAEPRLVIQLRNGPTDAQLRPGTTLRVQTINAGYSGLVDVPASAYRVDCATRTIEFPTAQAGWVNAAVGTLFGKPVWVDYTRTDPADPGDPGSDVSVTEELHVLADIVRFQYTPYVIKLNHPLVRADANLSFSLPNGMPLTRTAALPDATSLAAAGLPNMPAGWTQVYPRALLTVAALAMPAGEVLRPGSEFIASYEYLDPVTLTAQMAHERYQVPVNFGSSVSSPALAGTTMHVGTEGFRPDAMHGIDYPLLNPETYGTAATPSESQLDWIFRSLLSVVLDPITKTVRGSLAEAAIPAPTIAGTAAVSAPPALDGEGVVVGSRLMTRLTQIEAPPSGYQGQNVGYVSRLRAQRTLICDTTRLVEVEGQRLNWVCTGTKAPQYHEALDPLSLGNQELKVTPFSRPAKAIYLSNGNILVCDTGNNRVVEMDRQGRQVWPLDENGYDYYTSTPALNPNLSLERPSDCYRYYIEWRLGTPFPSVNGNFGALNTSGGEWQLGQWEGTEAHTVIADTGNSRVIDVVTTITALGVQTHRVDVLTPSRVRLAQGMVKLAYTRAIPIIDPVQGDNAKFVIGYVCAASNLHQLVVVEAGTRRVDPRSDQRPAYGCVGSTWKWLAWLYDDDVDDTDYAPTNPLIFRNIRDVELAYEGDLAYLTITCARYAGRLANITPTREGGQSGAGAGAFEFAMSIGPDPTTWARVDAVTTSTPATVLVDTPIWSFTDSDFHGSSSSVHYLTSILYKEASDAPADPPRSLDLPWSPVSCMRLPSDRRVQVLGTMPARQVRHLITNYAQLIQNMSRDTVAGLATLSPPAMLGASVFVVSTDDRGDAAPGNDAHELDRREVIPNPHEPDWTDPFNQPAYATRR